MKKSLNQFHKKIILGLANINNNYGLSNKKISFQNKNKFLNYLKKNKINQLDWSFDYSNSYNSLNLFKKRRFFIDTKINNNNIFKDLNFLNKMIDEGYKFKTIYIRSPELLTNRQIIYIYNVLERYKAFNLINKIGYSIYDIDVLYSRDFPLPDTIQLPLNIFDQRFLLNPYYDVCQKNNIEIIARSIFLQGKLVNFQNINFHSYEKYYIQNWINFLNKHNMNSLQAIKSFYNSLKNINKIVIGIDNIKHLSEFLSSDFYYLKTNFFKKLSTIEKKIVDPRIWKH